MEPRQIARLLVAGRLVIGASLVAFAARAAPLTVRRRRDRRAARLLLRAAGIRDLLLASGLLAALSGRGSVRGWALGGAAADGFDLLAALAVRRQLEPHTFAGIVAGASTGVVQGLMAARAPD